MVLRDAEIIKEIPDAEVGMTVTTTDDELGRLLEVRATSASMRIEALKSLNKAGIRTYAFVGPLLPHFRYRPELLDALFAGLAAAGIREVYVEQMNLSSYIRKRLFDALAGNPRLQEVYRAASTDQHRKELDKIVGELLHKRGLKLRLNEVIYHH
jgi:DNA repair photolyase